MTISRAVLNSLLPEGTFWTPAAQSDYDLLLEGIADNTEEVYQVLKSLACIRCPETTTLLEDLEKEYGIIPATLATESERRSRLEAFIYRRAGTGAWDLLQSKLREAGFDDVYVHPNDPAVDPNIFLTQAFNMMCGDLLPGGNDAQCGEPEAICAQVGGELVVNGDLFKSVPNYINLAGEDIGCGEDVFCGDFDGYKASLVDITYEIPTDSGYWPLIFFVGGQADRKWKFLDESIVYYPFNSDTLDYSGNGYDGTPTDITYASGAYGNGAVFNGATGVINCGNVVDDITGYNFSFWFKRNGLPSLYERIKINYVDSSNYIAFICSLNGKIEFRTMIGGSSSSNYTSNNLCDGSLHHVVLNIIDSTHIQFIIDGVAESIQTLTVPISTLTAPTLYLGAQVSSAYFTGLLDEFRIFPRNLTLAEITALYDSNGLSGGDGGLTEIEFYTLPIQRRLEFRRTILKFKPMHSWGGLIVVYS